MSRQSGNETFVCNDPRCTKHRFHGRNRRGTRYGINPPPGREQVTLLRANIAFSLEVEEEYIE